ncbi:MAG TPA: PQQ-binding-like beta-propeller repeat protein, partial [Kofleriaceae bacterium]
ARGSLRIYNHDGALAATIQLPVRASALRSRGTRLVAMPSDFAAHPSPALVDLQHARLVTNLDGHAGFVFSARWIDDRLLTTAGDGVLRMWDGSDGRLLQTFRVYAGYLADATMSADGRLLIAGGADGVMRFWDIATGRLLWQLQAHDAALVGIQLDGNDIVTRGFSGDLARWHIPSTEHVIATCGAQSSCASPSP